MAAVNKCRLCGKTVTKKADRVSIDKVNDKEFTDWASYVFNVKEVRNIANKALLVRRNHICLNFHA
jgi:hypothetical protein